MKTLELLRINLHVGHDVFNGTVADVTQEMADWVPPGIALPIGERYAHTVAAEDWLVNGISRGGAPWFATSWAGRTGFGEMNLGMTPDEARAVHVDLDRVREYAGAVFAASEEYLNSLDDAEVDRMYDMSMVGRGSVPAPAWWSTFIIAHLHNLTGEISALKGCQGKKGYPF